MPSAAIQSILLGLSRTGRCHFCGTWGVIVKEFPRRGYGGGKYKMQML